MAGTPEKMEIDKKKPEPFIPDCSRCEKIKKWKDNQIKTLKGELDSVYKLVKEAKSNIAEGSKSGDSENLKKLILAEKALNQAEKEILEIYTKPVWDYS